MLFRSTQNFLQVASLREYWHSRTNGESWQYVLLVICTVSPYKFVSVVFGLSVTVDMGVAMVLVVCWNMLAK